MNQAQFAQLVAMIQAMQVRLDEEHVWIAGRFAAMQAQMDERFAAVDARFDAVDARFAAVDARFDAVDNRLDAVDARFDAVDARFDAVDARFDGADARFDAVDTRFDRERSLVAGQFEAMQKYMDKRFNQLAEALEIQFTGLDRRVRRLENNR